MCIITQWNLKEFSQLSVTELYRILQLRNKVFIVEQNCVFLDLDDIDFVSWHLFGFNEIGQKPIAYSRLIPPNIVYDDCSIGRVVSEKEYRTKGIGIELMEKSILETKRLFSTNQITIGAQLYLKNFYSKFGFSSVGEIYLEDGIEHIKMKLS